ncbi:type II restriction endonuclease [Rhizobium ruizarguesonis]
MDIKRGHLSDYFEGVAVKRLTKVDATPESNQHEVGTTRAMESFLGREKRVFEVSYVWLGSEQDAFSVDGTATMYDSRERQTHRSAEWRLYYPSNPVTEAMNEGDALFLAMEPSGRLHFIVTAAGSTSEKQLLWLFGIEPSGKSFISREITAEDDPGLDFAARFILDELGIEFEDPKANELDTIIDRFGLKFPTTAIFSDLARLTLPGVRAEDDPDAALVVWLDHEEALFRRLERRIVADRLTKGFANGEDVDVDGFISFSLSVQNRRKSRMGHSLENHLEAVFQGCGIQYVRGAITEAGNKPDFLFPNQHAYQTATVGSPDLVMLAAKSTCKDRWRQVLPEALKIPEKHLITLEPGISTAQTTQMAGSNLSLIVPTSIQESYTIAQRAWLWSVTSFVAFVSAKQQ